MRTDLIVNKPSYNFKTAYQHSEGTDAKELSSKSSHGFNFTKK